MSEFYSRRTVNVIIVIYTTISVGLTLAAANFLYAGNVRLGLILVVLVITQLVSIRIGHELRLNQERDSIGRKKPVLGISSNPPTSILDKKEGWDGFDIDDPRYPEELDIAFQAWRAVSNSPSNAPVREQLSEWLKQSGYKLSSSAIDRITVICNWDKTGGRPKST